MNFTKLIPLFFSAYLPLLRNEVTICIREVVLYTCKHLVLQYKSM